MLSCCGAFMCIYKNVIETRKVKQAIILRESEGLPICQSHYPIPSPEGMSCENWAQAVGHPQTHEFIKHSMANRAVSSP